MSHVSGPTISYEKLLIKFKELIKKSDLKYTTQREIILETLYKSDEHLTPETLLQLIQKNYPDVKIGIATIYRTLTMLENSDLVTSISFGAQGKKYELGHKQHHDHMICTSCDEIIEFVDEKIEKLQEDVAKKVSFKITAHTMQIFGICKNCQDK